MTDEEKKRLAARVAAQGDAGGSSTNGRLSAPNTNSAMTGLRTGEDLEKGYKSPTPLETAEYLRERNMGGVMLPEVEVVGTAQTPVDGTQTIPQEIPDGSTVMTMGDGNKGVVTPQGQTLVPNAEQYQLPMTADGKVRPVLDMAGNSRVPANVGAPSVPQSPVVPMNTSGAIQPVDMSQVNSEQVREQSLRGANPVDNTKGANTEGEYWRVAPKEEVKAQPSQTEKQERVIPDYMQSENFQRGLNESLEMGGKTEAELKGENDMAKRLDNALLSDYDDSSLLLQEYAKGLITPEEEERRARRARAAEGWAHIGNIISGFAGLANTKKGSPNIDLADVKDAKVDEWRDKVRTNRNTYDKMRVQLEHQRNLAKWRDANLREKIRMNDIKVKQAETEQDYKKALLTLKEIEADYKQAMVDLQAAKTRAIANKDEREERYLEARLQELQEKINATRKLAEEREARANNIRNGLPANGGSSGSGTSKPVVVGGKEVANPRKLNQGDVNRHIKAVAKNNGIEMTKRGSGGLDEKDKTIDELGEEIAGNPKALQELRDRLANGESGGNITTQSKGEDKTPPSRRGKQNKNDNTPPSRRK
jgi:hypothetical protein